MVFLAYKYAKEGKLYCQKSALDLYAFGIIIKIYLVAIVELDFGKYYIKKNYSIINSLLNGLHQNYLFNLVNFSKEDTIEYQKVV